MLKFNLHYNGNSEEIHIFNSYFFPLYSIVLEYSVVTENLTC